MILQNKAMTPRTTINCCMTLLSLLGYLIIHIISSIKSSDAHCRWHGNAHIVSRDFPHGSHCLGNYLFGGIDLTHIDILLLSLVFALWLRNRVGLEIKSHNEQVYLETHQLRFDVLDSILDLLPQHGNHCLCLFNGLTL